MEELNYHPNFLARSLRSGTSKTIGLVVPDNSNPFFANIARIAEDIGFMNGYSVMLCNSDGSLEKEKAYIKVLTEKRIDGIIFIASGSDFNHLQNLANQGIPTVLADRECDQQIVDEVLVDNEQGGHDATQYLIDLGHRKIGCISGPSMLTPSSKRVLGYKKALSAADIPIREEYIISGDFRSKSGEEAMKRFLDLPTSPSAVFACNDMMAFGAYKEIKNRNYQIPDNVSIVGFDDIPLSSIMTPTLTTIAQPITELATISTSLLIQRIKEDEPGEIERIIMKPKLVIRESCKEHKEGN
jgi:LacI family transcriptional regulator